MEKIELTIILKLLSGGWTCANAKVNPGKTETLWCSESTDRKNATTEGEGGRVEERGQVVTRFIRCIGRVSKLGSDTRT
jgi:hypothetical protein